MLWSASCDHGGPKENQALGQKEIQDILFSFLFGNLCQSCIYPHAKLFPLSLWHVVGQNEEVEKWVNIGK
jgi:hypothetical protein